MSGNTSSTPQVQQTSTGTREPWANITPQLNDVMSEAQRQYAVNGGQQYTPWSQIADLNSNQLGAIQGTRDYVNSAGTQGLLQNSSNLVSGLLSGQGYNPQSQIGEMGAGRLAGYLGNNNLADTANGINRFMYQDTSDPSLQQNIQGAVNAVQNNMGGVTPIQGIGKGIADKAYTLNRDNAINGMYSNAYDTQQQQRLAAIGLGNQYQNNQAQTTAGLLGQGADNSMNAQSLGLQNYNQVLSNPLQLLQAQSSMGDVLQNYNQSQLTDATNRWNNDQNAQWDALTRYSNLIAPIAQMGGTNTGAEIGIKQNSNNRLGNGLGGAMSGAAMGSTFGPWGALAGGVAGGALGALSK